MLRPWIREYLSRERKHVVPGVFLAIALATIFSVMLGGAMRLVTGPLYRTSNLAQCQELYAKAKTQAETTAVDFRPYADSTGKRGHRCGITRSVTLVRLN